MQKYIKSSQTKTPDRSHLTQKRQESFSRQRDREISGKSIRRISNIKRTRHTTFAKCTRTSLSPRVYTRYRSLIEPLTRMAFRANTPRSFVQQIATSLSRSRCQCRTKQVGKQASLPPRCSFMLRPPLRPRVDLIKRGRHA